MDYLQQKKPLIDLTKENDRDDIHDLVEEIDRINDVLTTILMMKRA